MFQNFFMKAKEKPSGPGAFSEPHSHTAALTSSPEKEITKDLASCSDSFFRFGLRIVGRSGIVLEFFFCSRCTCLCPLDQGDLLLPEFQCIVPVA
ncbi:hypothetical protein QVD17_31060 [Tagetes erecta]|uniref:Uncharacterized protein n=1 Tax=Tagetes erecta TaxID=13708 RepID=A0AAD8K301_TARER|nr:hypothetical protein QVD17_31060 [Tagetes erecta]